MKSIGLATDFSSSAKHAAIFAGQLASDQKATLTLVHAFQVWPDNPAKTGDFLLPVAATIESSEKSLHRLANELHDKIGPDVVMPSTGVWTIDGGASDTRSRTWLRYPVNLSAFSPTSPRRVIQNRSGEGLAGHYRRGVFPG